MAITGFASGCLVIGFLVGCSLVVVIVVVVVAAAAVVVIVVGGFAVVILTIRLVLALRFEHDHHNNSLWLGGVGWLSCCCC